MVVRPALAADVASIAEIHIETWRAAYRGQIPDAVLDGLKVDHRATFWREHLTQPETSVFVADEGHTIAGFCDLAPSRDRDADPRKTAEIVAIYVHPSRWRKGAGRSLCERALDEARHRGYRAVTLWVLASNSVAKRFYEAMEFQPDGAIKTEKATDGSDLHEVRFRRTI